MFFISHSQTFSTEKVTCKSQNTILANTHKVCCLFYIKDAEISFYEHIYTISWQLRLKHVFTGIICVQINYWKFMDYSAVKIWIVLSP